MLNIKIANGLRIYLVQPILREETKNNARNNVICNKGRCNPSFAILKAIEKFYRG